MSYNTRRTGTGRGGTGTTQVNYHQQPSRPAGNAAPARNPTGYSTQQQSNYNNSSQQGYTTQPQAGYTTAAPAKPAPPAPAQQSSPAAAQPPPTQPPPPPPQQPQQPAKQPVTPQLKTEPVTPAETPEKSAMETNGEEAPTKPPFWKKRPFAKVSNRVKKARQNAKLRRILNPKNALTFLNELRPGIVKFVVREEPNWGYVATVDIDGKTFSGHALTVSKAKVQASEQALKHLLLEQLSKSQSSPSPVKEEKEEAKEKESNENDESMETEDGQDDSGEPKRKKARVQPEDDVPWGSLAAFALHKLFAEWQKEGTEPHPPPEPHVPAEKYEEEMGEDPYYARRPGPPPPEYSGAPFAPRRPPFARGRGGFHPYPPRGPPPPPVFGTMPRRPPLFPPAARPAPIPGVTNPLLLPMKKIPEDANKRHPVMLLNQLKPNVIYNETKEGQSPNAMFVITVNIDGKEYAGRGKSKKEAKKNAAKAALAPLGIRYEDDV